MLRKKLKKVQFKSLIPILRFKILEYILTTFLTTFEYNHLKLDENEKMSKPLIYKGFDIY